MHNVPDCQPLPGAASAGRVVRLGAAVCAAALAFGVALTACRGGTPPAPTRTPAPTAGAVAASPVPQTSPTPVPSPMTLHVWVSPDFAATAQADGAALQGFSEMYPGVRVQISIKEPYGKGGLTDLLAGASRVAPLYLPDLVLTTEDSLAEIAALGLLQPIDTLLPTARDALFPGIGNTARLGVPFAMDFPLLAYRTPMTLPLSWDAIAATGGRYAFAAGNEDAAAQALLVQYLALGGPLVDAEGRPSLDGRLLTRALEAYSDLVARAILIPQAASLDNLGEVWDLYEAGQADFAAVLASQVRRNAAALADTGLAPPPAPDGGLATLARIWSWAVVSRVPERQQAAARFLEWVLQPTQQSAWCDAAGLVPTQPSAWPLAHLSPTHSEFMLSLAQAATPYPPALQTVAVSSALHTALAQVLAGQLSPRQAADQALAKIRQQ